MIEIYHQTLCSEFTLGSGTRRDGTAYLEYSGDEGEFRVNIPVELDRGELSGIRSAIIDARIISDGEPDLIIEILNHHDEL